MIGLIIIILLFAVGLILIFASMFQVHRMTIARANAEYKKAEQLSRWVLPYFIAGVLMIAAGVLTLCLN